VNLSGAQWQELSAALRSAFTHDRLERMLRFRLDKSLEDISLASDREQVVFEVIELSQSEGWTDRLVLAARESAPENAQLLAFAQQFGLASTSAPEQQLEQTIIETNSFLDVNKWRSKLGQLETKVCRVEVTVPRGTGYGTGFLVAPDVVITNYHVVEPVVLGEQGKTTAKGDSAAPSDVVVRFDYKVLADGNVLNPGTEYRLSDPWSVDLSPFSKADLKNAGASLPAADELDFALVRLAGQPGNEIVGAKGEPGSTTRGWIEVPAAEYLFAPDSALFILQHPDHTPLKLALDTRAIIETNANATRVLYRTNTEPGSSGSPCFDQNWNLVALHHSGDPNYSHVNPAQFNRGIPIAAIRRLLTERGKADVLAAAPASDGG
jgi:hypothetical protein